MAVPMSPRWLMANLPIRKRVGRVLTVIAVANEIYYNT